MNTEPGGCPEHCWVWPLDQSNNDNNKIEGPHPRPTVRNQKLLFFALGPYLVLNSGISPRGVGPSGRPRIKPGYLCARQAHYPVVLSLCSLKVCYYFDFWNTFSVGGPTWVGHMQAEDLPSVLIVTLAPQN